MKGEQYKEMNAFFSQTKKRSNTMKTLHDILPLLMLVFYPIEAIYLLVTEGIGSEVFLRFTLIPLGTFLIITLVRALINAKRPYEKFDYTPVVGKSTKGKSFPSRHTVSAFIIAMAFLYVNTSIGVIMLVIASLIGVSRILCGVHFIRDVLWGAVIGVAVGALGYFVF